MSRLLKGLLLLCIIAFIFPMQARAEYSADIAGKNNAVSIVAKEQYKISYDSNGGTGSMETSEVFVNDDFVLPENSFEYTDYVFSHWNTKPDGSGVSYDNKATVNNIAEANQEITLYAIWELNVLKIQFHENGNAKYGVKGSMEDKEFLSSDTFTLPRNDFVRKFFEFKGWNTKADGTGTAYTDEEVIDSGELTESIELYAQWEVSAVSVSTADKVNFAFKELAGAVSPNLGTIDNNIKHIKRYTDSVLTDADLASLNAKQIATEMFEGVWYPVYAWFDTDTIYWYSEAEWVAVSDVKSLFEGFQSLESVEGMKEFVPGPTCKQLDNVFKNCKALLSLDGLEHWDTNTLKTMDGAFLNCTSLEDISAVENWDTSNVTSMSRLFRNCTSLESLDSLQSWDARKVTSLKEAFQGMDALSDLTGLSNWQTDSLTNLNNVFATGPSNSPSLTNLSGLDNWNTSKVTDMGYMFNDLKSLTDISALANWDFSSVNTLQRAFRHTSIETTDGLGNKTFNNLKNLEGLFFECTSLKDISDLATWDGTFKRTQKALECLLQGCTNLESLDGLDSPLFNNASNDGSGFSLSHTFDNCKKVTDLSPITNWNTDGLMKMDYTFVAVSMTDVNPIQNWDVTDVQSLRACFWKCSQLNDISALAAWGTKVHNVNDNNQGMNETFVDCYSLTDMSALNDWELYHTSLTTFSNMIKGISSTNSVHPEWTKITGSWQNATFNKTGTVLGTLGLYDNTNKLGEIKVVGE